MSYITMLSAPICTAKYVVYGLIPTIFVVYSILGVVAYLSSLVFHKDTKAKIQFGAIIFFVAGVIGMIITFLVTVPLLMNISSQFRYLMECPFSGN